MLTPLFGDADLYVNVGKDTMASRTSYDYSSLSSTGIDTVTVSSSDAKYIASKCNPAQGQSSCIINIGVVGFSSVTAYYTLVASTSNAVLRVDGTAQSGAVLGSNYTNYVFDVRQPGTTVRA